MSTETTGACRARGGGPSVAAQTDGDRVCRARGRRLNLGALVLQPLTRSDDHFVALQFTTPLVQQALFGCGDLTRQQKNPPDVVCVVGDSLSDVVLHRLTGTRGCSGICIGGPSRRPFGEESADDGRAHRTEHPRLIDGESFRRRPVCTAPVFIVPLRSQSSETHAFGRHSRIRVRPLTRRHPLSTRVAMTPKPALPFSVKHFRFGHDLPSLASPILLNVSPERHAVKRPLQPCLLHSSRGCSWVL